VVADALVRHDVRVRLMPEDSFFMKPLTTAIEQSIGAREDGARED
jgi:uroporphyrinogen-III synthase